MRALTQFAVNVTERGYVPDRLVRHGIRALIRLRLREIQAVQRTAASTLEEEFIEHMSSAAIAPLPEKANEQHYEVPADFFRLVLGPHLKYSSGYWPSGTETLADAESAALAQTCAHARLEDGQSVLELGCGWGSLTLWIAERYPRGRVTAVSNSRSQREYILAQADRRGLRNVRVDTCDMNRFDVEPETIDRVVSVEMFEHMRNWPALFARIQRWLKPDGMFFMHVFAHRTVPYLFDDMGPSDWMSRHFFTGGIMPSDRLPLALRDQLELVRHWRWEGTHYERTANAWLDNMDRARTTLWPVLERTYGRAGARLWWMRWRMFFMACAELFGYERGEQWGISHYLFRKPLVGAAQATP